jgi:hypothetical protein
MSNSARPRAFSRAGFFIVQTHREDTVSKIVIKKFAKLFPDTPSNIYNLAIAGVLQLLVSEDYTKFSLQDTFSYADALEIEVARQLSDDHGIPLRAASKLASNAGAAFALDISYGTKSASDFWVAIVQSRNTCPETSRPWAYGAKKSTLPDEYWSSCYFSGTFAEASRAVADYIERQDEDVPDADASRVFMANASAADRRLRKRAAKIGVDIVDGEFA